MKEEGPTSDPRQIEKKEIAKQQRDLDWHNWMIKTLNTYEGRALVWSLLEESQLFHTSFVGEKPMTMSFREGKKHMGQFLYSWVLQSKPDAYSMMADEHKERLVKFKAQEEIEE
jgi:hypothetical protein